ncbi:MAG: 30S ribosomal protein S6--L-glutamate ligase [Verrucomicrobiia bacterium Tous-C3TDCM]|nr:MAG: 30S ribosomal protein S6--L-glutamate ligase [Verrucomicrobiae bacterium Tous-C3TDCM]PAZ05290.1 MAG: 30S ribosomal protein S6--L-glutamate ligase [Verrucomicrobiae bacterium AMD-G2]
MNLIILSRNPALYSTQALVQAAEARGHKVRVVDYLRCYMNITSSKPRIYLEGEELHADAIIPRIAVQHTAYGNAVVRQFEMMGVFTLNDSVAISRSRDKLRSLQLLAKKGIGLPVTGFAHSIDATNELISMCGGAPLVVKLLQGTQGMGVVLAETKKAAESVIEAFKEVRADILVQEYIAESKGSDIRCIVLGKKVVASMIRQGIDGEFRSNLHRGGQAKKVKISAEERKTAIRSAKIMGLHLAGVDLLRSARGPLVMEVNSSPGLEGIEKSTNKNVADAIIEFLEASLKDKKTQSIDGK